MDPKKLIPINKGKDNVGSLFFPYQRVVKGGGAFKVEENKKMVVFFGNDMATFVKAGIDSNAYVAKCNECLGYIRKRFGGYRLCFKPHPADKFEQSQFDLSSFEVLNDRKNAELFLFENYATIKSVFSVGSAAAYSAYGMGLDSHLFYKCFDNIFNDEFMKQFREFYYDMPESFFITNLNERGNENSRSLVGDDNFERFLEDILREQRGDIWINVFTVEYAVMIIALSEIIKNIEPNRKINLVISSHGYWKKLDKNYFNKYFNKIIIFPRIHYSLRPGNLWRVIKTVAAVKSLDISEQDVLVSITQSGFVENCMNAYYKKNFKVGLIMNKDFNLLYNNDNLIYRSFSNFRFNKASRFFYFILEPLLRLNRTILMFYGQGGASFINRYQKPLNDVFDRLLILKV